MKNGTTYYGQFLSSSANRVLGVFRSVRDERGLTLENYTPEGWKDDPTLIDDRNEANVREISEAEARAAMGQIAALVTDTTGSVGDHTSDPPESTREPPKPKQSSRRRRRKPKPKG